MNNPSEAPINTILLAQWSEKEEFLPAQVILIDGKRVWGIWTGQFSFTRKPDPPIDWSLIIPGSQSLDARSRGKV
jgi:hypothetical protein